MARLILQSGPNPGKVFAVGPQIILGRHRNADVVIEDSSASRRHAAILRREGGEFHLRDLDSRNGTLLNGALISGETPLADGDLIRIGEEVFQFRLEAGASPRGAPHPSGAVPLSAPSGNPSPEPLREHPTATLDTLPLERRRPRQTAEPEPQAGGFPREFGKYLLLSPLGRGGMGEVFRARDRDGGPDVALKLIRADIGNRDAFFDAFHNREAVLAREIDHPNIIRVFEHGVARQRHYLAMEYVAGESLQERLKRGPLPFPEALEVLRQVACGLAAAHRRSVVHSDIKPGNILMLANPAKAGSVAGEARSDSTMPGDPGSVSPVVLEFPDGAAAASPRYEGALREEIHRRLGEPAQDLLLDPPFLPRASEMQFLQHYWESLPDSGGFLVLVEGDPGTGRDRLLSEFVKDLRLEPPGQKGRVLELEASLLEGIPRLHAAIRPDRPPVERPTSEAVEEILRGLESSEEPTVVRVLSLESASPLAGQLLEGVLRLLPDRPILLLSSFDPASLPRKLILRGLLASAGTRLKELYLRPLTRYQIGRYLQDLFREPARDERLAADLHRLTGGNFARLLETLRSFVQSGVLRLDRPAGRVSYQPSPRELELTEGKQLFEKYRALSRMEARILEHAAFIGVEFLFDTLHRFTESDETALFFIIRDLCLQGFLHEPTRGWYRFSNLPFQGYLAERFTQRDRGRLHRKVAWLLDEAPLGMSPGLHRLRASHWEGCGEHSKAVRLLLEGAHLARAEYEIDLARQMYGEILRIYRSLAGDSAERRRVTGELRAWFHRDANWYEVLGNLGEESLPVQVKITDFGISFKVPRGEEEAWIDPHQALGTPRYLAPERVRRERGGPKSDIFSLAIIAHEMLAGAPPFPGKRGAEVMRANLELEIPAPRLKEGEAPDEFYDLYRGMAEKDPELRWDAERVLRTIAKIQFELKMEGQGN